MTIKQAIARLQNLRSMEEFDLCTFLGVYYQGIKDDYDEAIDMAIKALTTETGRKKGKWIDLGFNDEMWGEAFECSICGELMIGTCNYCFNCGADMREGEEGI